MTFSKRTKVKLHVYILLNILSQYNLSRILLITTHKQPFDSSMRERLLNKMCIQPDISTPSNVSFFISSLRISLSESSKQNSYTLFIVYEPDASKIFWFNYNIPDQISFGPFERE